MRATSEETAPGGLPALQVTTDAEARRAFSAKATKPKRRGVATTQAVTRVKSEINITSGHRVPIMIMSGCE